MNPYFWLFAFCALWMTPVSAQVSVRVGDGIRYRVRFQASGLPVWQKRKPAPVDAEEKQLRSQDVTRGIRALSWPVALAMLREGDVARALRCMRMERLCLNVKISPDSAASTALLFAAVRVAFRTLGLCAGHPLRMTGRVEMNFGAEGSECRLLCILSARVGSLGISVVRLLLTARRKQAKLLKTEEESYAASH